MVFWSRIQNSSMLKNHIPVLTRARQLQCFFPMEHPILYGDSTRRVILESVWMFRGHTVHSHTKLAFSRCTYSVGPIVVGRRHFWLSFCGRLHIYYLHTLYIMHIPYVYIQLHTYVAGHPPWQRAACQQLWWDRCIFEHSVYTVILHIAWALVELKIAWMFSDHTQWLSFQSFIKPCWSAFIPKLCTHVTKTTNFWGD